MSLLFCSIIVLSKESTNTRNMEPTTYSKMFGGISIQIKTENWTEIRVAKDFYKHKLSITTSQRCYKIAVSVLLYLSRYSLQSAKLPKL